MVSNSKFFICKMYYVRSRLIGRPVYIAHQEIARGTTRDGSHDDHPNHFISHLGQRSIRICIVIIVILVVRTCSLMKLEGDIG